MSSCLQSEPIASLFAFTVWPGPKYLLSICAANTRALVFTHTLVFLISTGPTGFSPSVIWTTYIVLCVSQFTLNPVMLKGERTPANIKYATKNYDPVFPVFFSPDNFFLSCLTMMLEGQRGQQDGSL